MKAIVLLTTMALSFVGCTQMDTGSSTVNSQRGVRKNTPSGNSWQGIKIDFTRRSITEELIDPELIFAPITTNSLKKSQFETQAEYQSRLSTFYPAGQTYYLKLDSALVDYAYDADSGMLTVGARCSFPTILRWEERDSNSWEARCLTVAGKRWETRDVRQLNITNFEQLPALIRPGSDSMGLSFPIARDDARQLVERREATLVLAVRIGDLRLAAFEKLTRNAELPARLMGAIVISSKQRMILASLIAKDP